MTNCWQTAEPIFYSKVWSIVKGSPILHLPGIHSHGEGQKGLKPKRQQGQNLGDEIVGLD